MSAPVVPVVPGRLTRVRATVAAYAGLAKTRIIEQLLVVTVPAMFLAQRGIPSPWLVAATLVGGAGAAASAHALNCVVDADIDKVMKRTSRRPLARGQVPPRHALVFGLVLGAISAVWLGLTANWLAAALSVAAIAFYVLVYTLLLKRRTAQNIVWGGAAGCMPVVIGWAAVTGTVQWPALVMFAIIFFWTPPHFWALAMRYRDDYAAAGVPMLPVVATPEQVSRRIVAYAWVMAAVTLLLLPVTDAAVPPLQRLPLPAVRGHRRRRRAGPAGPRRHARRLSARRRPSAAPGASGQAAAGMRLWGFSTYLRAAPASNSR